MVIHPAAAAGYQIGGRAVSRGVLAGAALVLAVVVVAPRSCWRRSRLGITAVHEGGHALTALLVGRKVTAIHLRRDSSGVTIHYGRGGRTRRILTAAAGYPAPALLGVAGSWLVAHGRPDAWLVVLLVLALVNVVLWMRNLFGLVVMALVISAIGWLMVRGTAGVDALVGASAVWFLALGGLRAALEVPAGPATSDASDLGRLAHLPVGLWKAGFVALSAVGVIAVTRVLAVTW